jgi:hypothetical protein
MQIQWSGQNIAEIFSPVINLKPSFPAAGFDQAKDGSEIVKLSLVASQQCYQ